ncbi:hypothetical protein DL93DRAFT_2234770, partial [Clavulina sp. PMI_390]
AQEIALESWFPLRFLASQLFVHVHIYIDTLFGHSKPLQGATLSDLEQGIDQHVRGTLSA